jgi:hypothetical protein
MAIHVLPAGTVKRIHVDRRIVAQNRRLPAGARKAAAITIQTSRGPIKARHVEVRGAGTMIQRDDKPLKCGARIWLETRAHVAYLP